jgi:hypothetical protein
MGAQAHPCKAQQGLGVSGTAAADVHGLHTCMATQSTPCTHVHGNACTGSRLVHTAGMSMAMYRHEHEHAQAASKAGQAWGAACFGSQDRHAQA